MNPPDFTIDHINVIDSPDAVQIRDQNGQTSNVNRQTAYNTIVTNPRIQKLSFNRNTDNARIMLIPDVGSNLHNYDINLDNIIIVDNENYIIVFKINPSPAATEFITFYHLPAAPAAQPPAAAAPVPQDAVVADTPEYRAALANRITCPVCMEHEKNTRLNPCGHLLCAHDAAIITASDSSNCPICRTPIQSTSGIFYGGFHQKYLKYSSKLSNL